MKTIIILTFCLVNFIYLPVKANDLDDEPLAEEFFDDSELQDIGQDGLDELEDFGAVNKWHYSSKNRFKYHRGEKSATTPFRALLTSGTIIRSKPDWKLIKTSRNRYVMASPHDPFDAYADLLDKDGKSKYVVRITNLRSIESDLDLNPTPKQFETYPKRKKTKMYDSVTHIENHLHINFESLSGEYFSYFMQEDIESIKAQSLNIASYLNWTLPFNVGLTMSYSNFSETLDYDTLYGEYLFLGPSIMIPLKKFKSFDLFSTLTFQHSIRFNIKYAENEYQLTSNALKSKIGVIIPTWIGNVMAGIGYTRLIPKLENSSHLAKDSPVTNTISVYSAWLGYNINLDI